MQMNITENQRYTYSPEYKTCLIESHESCVEFQPVDRFINTRTNLIYFVESYNCVIHTNKWFQRNHSNPCNEPSFHLNNEFI